MKKKVYTNIKRGNSKRHEDYFPSKRFSNKHINSDSCNIIDKIRTKLFDKYDIKKVFHEINKYSVTYNNFQVKYMDSIRYVYYLMGWSNVEYINNELIFTK